MEKLVACIAQVWFWPILPQEQSSNPEGSVGLFYELCSLVLSIDFLLDSSQVIGWAILAALISFSETIWEFPWLCLGSLSCWNVHPHFIFIILVDGSRFFIKNVSVHFPIYTSFNYMNFASATPWCFGVMCSAIWPPHMVCIMASK